MKYISNYLALELKNHEKQNILIDIRKLKKKFSLNIIKKYNKDFIIY